MSESLDTARPAARTGIPLCVAMDGALLPKEMVAEGVLKLVKRRPAALLGLPFWAVSGGGQLSAQVDRRVDPDPRGLPYDEPLLDLIRTERASGRRVILFSAGRPRLADAVAHHLGGFDHVVAIPGGRSAAARSEFERRFGRGGFELLGPKSLGRRSDGNFRVWERTSHRSRWRSVLRALRWHQWLKNLLVFLPVLAGQQFDRPDVVLRAALAFVAFSLVASSVYVINDLLDLSEDRQHPTKHNRPFASGALPLSSAPFLLTALLLGAGLIAARLLPTEFAWVLGVYVVLTFAYSLKLKGAVLIDVLILAGLYTMRIIAGSAATGITPSVWLLGFSLFFFLSLAMLKRYAELHHRAGDWEDASTARLPGRGYRPGDLPVLIALGIGTGCVAVLVLALYVISDEFAIHYRRPLLLLQLCPLALYWIGRAWIVASRDEMDDDPVVWAVKDQLSRWVAAASVAILVLAR
ncbi:MAG: UbiA family prenyltransferase [Longimicrobiales bacterium]|nr:UbiA family prenyltransferase [Longimicrobiales bacterium]